MTASTAENKTPVRRRTRERKTASFLRREVIEELERMAMGDGENARDRLKAMELLIRLTESEEGQHNRPIVVRVEMTDDDPED